MINKCCSFHLSLCAPLQSTQATQHYTCTCVHLFTCVCIFLCLKFNLLMLMPQTIYISLHMASITEHNNRKNTIEQTFPPDFLVHIIIFRLIPSQVNFFKRKKKTHLIRKKKVDAKSQRENKPVGYLPDAHRGRHCGKSAVHTTLSCRQCLIVSYFIYYAHNICMR